MQNTLKNHTSKEEHLRSGKGRVLSGVVISNNREKTLKVQVTRKYKHPLYGKMINETKNYHVHTDVQIEIGTKVEILECRPISKTKTWIILK